MKSVYVAIVLILGILLSANAFTTPRHHKGKIDPALAKIHKIYVKGNNEVAVDLRQDIIKDHQKYGANACFAAVGNAKLADGVLEVSSHEETATLSSLMGGSGGAMAATGTLSDKQGNLIWSQSAHGHNGIARLSAKGAAWGILQHLYEQACGNRKGQR